MSRTAALLGAAIAFSLAIVPADVPSFEVDPFWPKPLPNHWILGSVTGVAVDAQDHIWLVHRGMDSLTARTEAGLATDPPTAESCCAPAPPVLEFDQAGNLVGHWGGPGAGFEWPKTLAGIDVDRGGHVWIAGDTHVLKFTRTGTFVAQVPATDRVAVFNAVAGAFKPERASASSCVRAAKDGKVYVCDRKNDRIQVFQKDGKFLQEAFVSKTTLGEGSVWDIAFSPDAQQRFMYVADGADQTVWVLRRDTLEVISQVGSGGRYPGHFYGVGSVAVDSKGNLYTGETYEGKRLQKFIYKGLAAKSAAGPVREQPHPIPSRKARVTGAGSGVARGGPVPGHPRPAGGER
jgi:DNA-binding beta-propeller fold protein YncE